MSDRFDRRLVTMVVALASTGFTVTAAVFAGLPTLLVVLGIAIGGTTLPLYSLSIALAGDRLEPSEMVAASGTLVRINGLGAASGPLLAAAVTATPLGVSGFYLLVATGTTVVVLVAGGLLLRDGTLAPQVPYVAAAARATTTVTRSMLRTSAAAREKRAAKKVQKAERRRERGETDRGPTAAAPTTAGRGCHRRWMIVIRDVHTGSPVASSAQSVRATTKVMVAEPDSLT